MKRLIIAILIGILAGIVDVVPMVIQGIDKHANASAFVHWALMGPVIAYIQIPLSSWLKGIIVSEALALPVAILVMPRDPKSIIPIMAMSAVLGAIVGAATGRFANKESEGA